MILHESEFVRVCHAPGKSKYLLITFGPRGIYPKGEDFWGMNFWKKGSISMVGFVANGPDWYPQRHMDAALEAARRVAQDYDSILIFGASMGGYAALKYSARLGATRTVAFSPQYSISREQLGARDGRYESHYDREKHGDMAIRGEDISGRAYIIYDPFYRPDRQHVRRIMAASDRVVPVHVYMTGHGPIYAFAGTMTGLRLFDAALADDMPTLHAMALHRRKMPILRVPEAIRFLRRRESFDRAFALLEHNIPHLSGRGLRAQCITLLGDAVQHDRRDLFDQIAALATARYPDDEGVRKQLDAGAARWPASPA